MDKEIIEGNLYNIVEKCNGIKYLTKFFIQQY